MGKEYKQKRNEGDEVLTEKRLRNSPNAGEKKSNCNTRNLWLHWVIFSDLQTKKETHHKWKLNVKTY